MLGALHIELGEKGLGISDPLDVYIETEPTLMPDIYKVTAGATDGIISYLSTIDLIVENNYFQKTEGHI